MLPKEVFSGTEKFEEAQVSQHLQLLADFVSYVSIGRMEGRQTLLEIINISEGKRLPSERAHYIEHIKRPATLLDAKLPDGPESVVPPPNFTRTAYSPIADNRNSRIGRNIGEDDVAAHPTRAPRMPTQGLPLF